MADEADWVLALIVNLNNAVDGVLNFEVGGVPITAELGKDLILFFEQNRDFLLRIGQDCFCDFLALLHEKRDEDAFLVISSKMNADEIIAQLNADAEALKQSNDDYDQFVSQVLAFGKDTLLPLIAKSLLGLLVASL